MRDTCCFCDIPLKKERIKVERWINDKLYVLTDVPAEVCPRCGEKYFTPDIVNKMEKAISSNKRAEEILSVPVMSLKKVAV